MLTCLRSGSGMDAVRTLRLALFAATTVTAALLTSPAAAAPLDQSAGLGFDLDSATIPDLQQRMDHGRLSSVQLTGAYLSRIRTVDPKIHSVIALNQRAIAEAAASDLRRRGHHTLSALDGIPVLLKD